ncbi:hypothetical protein B0J12DRAFT_203681 [Macrophomina phaseolina]|uniref:Secreted protein n=1 Tax=Macrophomina phaseolina TaxID=35725 RepID=A0ABQ8G4Y5_9PEZI|nr:hypothetical protein B0J12DRAFT_203681 [Macrophomina phaseolina]
MWTLLIVHLFNCSSVRRVHLIWRSPVRCMVARCGFLVRQVVGAGSKDLLVMPLACSLCCFVHGLASSLGERLSRVFGPDLAICAARGRLDFRDWRN